MAWETVVGIETHAQLLTKSKIFSGASTAFGAAPNTQASAVDIALPGVLPVLNRAAVELAVRFGLAVGGPGVISRRSVFARKNYFYPDLPKGYQISQYEIPVVTGGSLAIVLPEGEKTIRLTRAHLEEDAGKSLHEDFRGMSGIDLNRAGTPLLEIVSEPELRGAKEAVAYARAMHALVRWIGICDGNMQEGSFRCDANVSVRKRGDTKLGTRCEIKNLNSFRFMEQAIEFEARRQIDIIEDGGKIVQETRLYDPDRNETRAMRSKEDAQDYRYFPDPDLLPLVISDVEIDRILASMPEMPLQRRYRFMASDASAYQKLLQEQRAIDDDADLDVKLEKAMRTAYKEIYHGLSPIDATTLTATRELSDYFEEVVANLPSRSSKLAANWILGEVSAYLNKYERFFDTPPVTARQLGKLLARIEDGTVSNKIAKGVFEQMCKVNGFAATRSDGQLYPRPESIQNEDLADQIIESEGLKQISDSGTIEKIVDEALAANARLVADYRSGKEKAFNALVGQVMKRSQGKANPAQVNEALRRKLKG